MPTLTFRPSGRTLTVKQGTNLLEACHKAGVPVAASCGGKGLCGKCRVRILEGEVPRHTGHEHALSPAEVAAGWRLACLIEVTEDLTLHAVEGAPIRTQILTDFGGREPEVDGAVRAVPLDLPKPSLEDQICDIGRIMRGLGWQQYPACSLPLLQDLPRRMREYDFRITAVVCDDHLLGVEPYCEEPAALGLAVDVGTTTIAGALFHLGTGAPLAVTSRTNPQATRGDDVVTRIEHARKGAAEREELQTLVVGALDEILHETCAMAGVSPERVYQIAVGGNTTMHHLLLGLRPDALAEVPFVACARRGLEIFATDVGLHAGDGARLYTVPNISAYVGGDIVAGILAHDVDRTDRSILMIDVGTNGEIVLRAGGVTYACATAAGPAFEGARISCGMRAASGAIDAVEWAGDDIRIHTVDDARPRGLCGTGLLDAVAVLLDLGVVDETGRMLYPDEAEEELDLPPAVLARLKEEEDEKMFVLSAEAESEGPELALTQKDVRELQLAKGAVAAGAAVMLGHAGLAEADLDAVYLAGGFGNYLRPASAQRVGLLPVGVPEARIRFIGNAALAGTRLCLLSHRMREEAETVCTHARYIELSGRMDFQAAFTEQMTFPEPASV